MKLRKIIQSVLRYNRVKTFKIGNDSFTRYKRGKKVVMTKNGRVIFSNLISREDHVKWWEDYQKNMNDGTANVK